VPLWQPVSVIFEYLCYIVCVSGANKYNLSVNQTNSRAAARSSARRMCERALRMLSAVRCPGVGWIIVQLHHVCDSRARY